MMKAVLTGKFTYGTKCLSEKVGEFSHQQLNSPSESPRTKEITPQRSRQQKIIKLRADINKTETNKQDYKESMKQKVGSGLQRRLRG